MPVPASFLIEPNDYTEAFLLNIALCYFHLLTAVALDAVEDECRQTMRLQSTRNNFSLPYLATDQGYRWRLSIVVEYLSPSPELSR